MNRIDCRADLFTVAKRIAMTPATKPNSDVCFLSAKELADQYRSKSLSPVEVAQAVLARIEKYDPEVNAFALLDPDRAMADARASEDRWFKRIPASVIDGVPTALKDSILVQGWPTLHGSLAIEPGDDDWGIDAPVTAKLRAAGAVLLGKTTMSEFGVKSTTESARHGVTRNPWNLAYSPGGSSGGAAVAAALGFGPLQVATDGGGSVRVPAALVGVFGFMPTHGRIPQYPASHQGSRFNIGFCTRSVYDTALLMHFLAQPDPLDWTALPPDNEDWTRVAELGVEGLRIAFCPSPFNREVDPVLAEAVERAADVYRELGAHVECASPDFPDLTEARRILGAVALARLVRGLRPERRALVDPAIRARAEEGNSIDVMQYLDAVEARADAGRRMLEFHRRFDLLLAPVSSFVALQVNQGDGVRFTMTSVFNLTQQPACSVPLGITTDGCPLAFQIIGPKYGDALVLRAAHAFEMACSCKFVPPLFSTKQTAKENESPKGRGKRPHSFDGDMIAASGFRDRVK